jgi:hypothetical protein
MAATWIVLVLPYRVMVTGANAAQLASLAGDGSRMPLARGRPRCPVRAGGSWCGAASLRSRVVQVMPGGSVLGSFPA